MAVLEQVRFDELKNDRRLPSPTGVALAILRLAQDENTTVPEIARVLEADPVMAGRVLRLANSAFAASGRPIGSIREAVTRLGVAAVRNLALGFSLLSDSRRGPCKSFDYGAYWSHSLATGVAAKVFSAQVLGRPPDEAFTCGLLCQVGKLAMASIFPELYGSVLDQSRGASAAELLRLEREHFATDHAELTAAMLRQWGLPATYAEAVTAFEHLDGGALEVGSRTYHLARLLSLATRVADVCAGEDDQRSGLAERLFSAGESVGITPDKFSALADEAARQWREWGKLLEVRTHELPPFAQLRDRPEPAGVSSGLPGEGALSIVVVDDDPVELKLLTRHLVNAGHQVRAVPGDGKEAVRVVLDTVPQMVITDRVMPEMDGVALCRTLRQAKVGRQIYIIMLTGCEEEEQLVEGLEAGADDYVVKPFRPRTLAARIRAGQRVIRLQEEANRDKEELCRYAAEIAVANRKLQQAALTDALTGLPNRRYAMERLYGDWEAGRPLACMLLDIDFFKRVNDTYGHDKGDLVLQATAGALRQAVRNEDAVCRLGGEEFLVLTSAGSEPLPMMRWAERLRVQVERNEIEAPEFRHRVTISLGVALRRPGMRNPHELLKAADEAVYAAKAGGRNRVCLAAGHEL